jgi:hypothetical protein
MYATRKLSPDTPNLSSVRKTVTRLVLDDQLVEQGAKSTAGSYHCRCTEVKANPEILCPSHWLSMQLPGAIH